VTVAFLALGSFAIGAAFGFLGPARQSYMFEIVEPERRGNAIALSQGVALNGARILGPALAGLALSLAFFGKGGAYFAMAALYIAAIVTTVMLPATKPNPNPSGRSVLGDMVSGVRYVAAHPQLRILILGYVLIIMMGFPYVTVLPGLVETAFDRDSDNVTILYAVSAAGGLGSSVWVASLADSPRANVVYPVASFLFGLSLIATGLAPTWFSLALAMFMVGVASGGFQTLNGALVAKVTEQEYFGRVISLTFVAFAAFGVVALPIGVVADIIGERPTLAIMGVIVCGIVSVFTPMDVRVRRALRSQEALPTGEAGG
jgi:MFS family permease